MTKKLKEKSERGCSFPIIDTGALVTHIPTHPDDTLAQCNPVSCVCELTVRVSHLLDSPKDKLLSVEAGVEATHSGMLFTCK